MAEQFYFFNSVSGDEREYDQNQFSLALKHIAESNGISHLDFENPFGTARQPNGDIVVNPGVMLIEGYIYYLDSTLILPGASYLQGQPRTDRLIVRLDRSVDLRSIKAQIILGTDDSVVPPDLIRLDNVYDMCIALIRWNGTTAVLEDVRADTDVCGYLRAQYATQEDLEDIKKLIPKIILSSDEPDASGPLLWFKLPEDDDSVIELFNAEGASEFAVEYDDERDDIENMTSDQGAAGPDDVVVHFGDIFE